MYVVLHLLCRLNYISNGCRSSKDIPANTQARRKRVQSERDTIKTAQNCKLVVCFYTNLQWAFVYRFSFANTLLIRVLSSGWGGGGGGRGGGSFHPKHPNFSPKHSSFLSVSVACMLAVTYSLFDFTQEF